MTLPAYEGTGRVYGADAREDEAAGIFARDGVYRRAVYVAALCGVDLGEAVYGPARAVKDAAQDLAGEGDGHGLSHETGAGALHVYAASAFKGLDDDPVAVYEDDPAAPAAAVGQDDLRELVIGRAVHALERDERALYLGKTRVFYAHTATPYAFARRTEATALSTSSVNSEAGFPPPSSNFMRSSAAKTPVSVSWRSGIFCATSSLAPS